MPSKIALVALLLVALSQTSSKSMKPQPPYSFVLFNSHPDNVKRTRSIAPPELPVQSVQVLPTPVPTVITPQAYVQQEPAVPVQYVHVERPVVPQYSVPQYGRTYEDEDDYAPAKYEFSYGVEDHVTGDIHSHREARDGDVTQGEYSLHEADGTIRTVKYTVNGKSGFNAIVERTAQQQYQ